MTLLGQKKTYLLLNLLNSKDNGSICISQVAGVIQLILNLLNTKLRPKLGFECIKEIYGKKNGSGYSSLTK